MHPLPTPSDPVTLGVRWLARGLSLLVAGTVALFFVGSGGFDPLSMSGAEAALMALFWTAWAGLLVAWRWELLGGAMTLGGMLLFYCVEFVADGHFPRGWAFAAIALPGVLFLWCGLRASPTVRHAVPDRE
jgi:hypothetical protein